MEFILDVESGDVRIPVGITGVGPDSHNKENNQLVMKWVESKGVLDLEEGPIEVLLHARGAPQTFQKPKGRANKKLCYSAFPMLEQVRLLPVR